MITFGADVTTKRRLSSQQTTHKIYQNTVFGPISPFLRGIKFRLNNSKTDICRGFEHSNVHLKRSVRFTRVNFL